MHNIVYARANRFAAPILEDGVRSLPSAVQCPQVPGMLEQAMGTGAITMQEDCLTLNVFAPEPRSKNLPVLVWIHGGAFTNGTANASWYDGGNLARRGCVVVAINYRLGAFGFAGPTDLGIQDQIAALRWVRRNVERFGGNPDNVTIFGESAGGCSVMTLYACQDAKDLFQRGWAMSPSLGQLRTTERAEESMRLLVAELGETSIADLGSKSTTEIIEAQGRLLRDPKDVVTMFSPTIGGRLVSGDAHRAMALDERPLVIGTMRDESRLWVALHPDSQNLSVDGAKEHFAARFGSDTDDAWLTYQRLRPNSTPAQLVAAMQSDESFRVHAWRVIDARDQAGTPTWSYFFTWPTPVFGGILGACHGLDIPFVFDNITAPNVEHFIGVSTAHRHLASSMANSLVQFATSGSVEWQPTEGKRTVLQIDERNDVVVDPERPLYDLWNR